MVQIYPLRDILEPTKQFNACCLQHQSGLHIARAEVSVAAGKIEQIWPHGCPEADCLVAVNGCSGNLIFPSQRSRPGADKKNTFAWQVPKQDTYCFVAEKMLFRKLNFP